MTNSLFFNFSSCVGWSSVSRFTILFFKCPPAQFIWRISPFRFDFSCTHIISWNRGQQWMHLTIAWKSQASSICCQIWKSTNDWVFQQKPKSTLDKTLDNFSKFLEDGDLKYTLYVVLVHAGWSTHSGHYYCFVRTSSGMWYYLDDNKVVQVNERKVLEQKAYMLFYFQDRKNFAPKRPVNIVQKDNFPMNAMGNKAHSSSSKNLKEMIHNIPIEKKLNGAVSSAAVDQRGALNACAAKVTVEKEASAQKINGPMMAEYNKDTSLKSSTNLLPLKDPQKELPVLNLSGGVCLPTSAPSVRGYRDTLKLDKVMITTTAGEVCDSNHDRSTKKDLNNSVASPPNYSGHHNPYTKRDLTDSVAMPPNNNEDRSTKKDLSGSVAIPSNCNGTYLSAGDIYITEETQSQKSDNNASLPDPSKKIFLVRSLNLAGNEDSQTGGFPKQSAVRPAVPEVKMMVILVREWWILEL